MFKKILVGLDGSQHGLKATTVASELASKFGAELHLLTVTRPYKASPALRQYLEAENLLGEPKYVLNEMTNHILAEAKDLANAAGVSAIKATVHEGKPARSIVDYAKYNDVDVIVLGSRGIGEVESTLLGSVSHKVSSLCACTCIIVK